MMEVVPLVGAPVGVRKRIGRKHVSYDRTGNMPERTQMRITHRALVPVHVAASRFVERETVRLPTGRDNTNFVELLRDQ